MTMNRRSLVKAAALTPFIGLPTEPGKIYVDSRPNQYNIGIRPPEEERIFLKFGSRKMILPPSWYVEHVKSHNNLALCKYRNAYILMTKMSYGDVERGISIVDKIDPRADKYSFGRIYVDQNRNMRLVKYYSNTLTGPITKVVSCDGLRV